MSATDIGRKPLTIVELEQPRCAERFGVSPCTATGTSCYNTPGTCGDLPNLNLTGSCKWRFMDDREGVFDFADFSDADNPEFNPVPILKSVSTSENEINAGSNLDGRDALGVTAKATISLSDFPFNDAYGDFYVASRAGYVSGKPYPIRGNFWSLWTARNLLFKDMYLRIYDGYEGEALGDMRQRLYVLDKVNGPNADGSTTLTGLDPLRLAGDKKAEFPRTSALDLFGDIDATSTTVKIFGAEADLSDAFGISALKYLVIGQEIIGYSGYSADGDGIFTLAGVVRGALNTVAAEHDDQDKVQRAGRYENTAFWLVLEDLFKNHTEIPDAFIPIADWNTEGNTYLPTYTATHTLVKPTPVKQLAGEIAQQGLFYIWWSEYDQEIKMLAVRAPDTTPQVLTDDLNIMRGSAILTRDPSVRLTQVAVYYDQIDLFGGATDNKNFRNRFTAVDGENLGETRAVSIYAPWVRNRTQAVQLAVRLLIRYRAVPKFLQIAIDAKDRTATIGSVVDIETQAIVDTEGNINRERWQVISAKEIKAGHSYLLNCQTYEFVGRFGRYMADGSPLYAAATDAEKLTGSWYAADTGLLSDGSEGYKYQ